MNDPTPIDIEKACESQIEAGIGLATLRYSRDHYNHLLSADELRDLFTRLAAAELDAKRWHACKKYGYPFTDTDIYGYRKWFLNKDSFDSPEETIDAAMKDEGK